MDSELRLRISREILLSCHKLYLWSYDSEMLLIESSCPDDEMFSKLLITDDSKEQVIRFAKSHYHPAIYTNELDMMWVVEPEHMDENLRKIHILGPFFVDNASKGKLEKKLYDLKLSNEILHRALSFLKELPVISISRIFEYTIMLHFSVTGETITASDIHYRKSAKTDTDESPEKEEQIHGTYAAEQEMLRFVREGDLGYKEHMGRMSLIGNTGKLSEDAMRQNKNMVLVCITLFSRAAIEGGLAPETSLTLTDRYFQSVEACRTVEELMEISHTMQEDFITRVHRCRYDTSVSRSIRACAEYIDLHLEDDLSLEMLSKIAGYSDYYLGKRFKKEMGVTAKEYIRIHRIEHAKYLLQHTQLSVLEICERLRFSSQSYFADAFRKSEGLSPTEYREKFNP